jgi:hypothetical protein
MKSKAVTEEEQTTTVKISKESIEVVTTIQ